MGASSKGRMPRFVSPKCKIYRFKNFTKIVNRYFNLTQQISVDGYIEEIVINIKAIM
jgi:NurA-like 5'-3' nuclease